MLFPPAKPREDGGGGSTESPPRGRKRKRLPADPAFLPTPMPELHAPFWPALRPVSVTVALLVPFASLCPWPPQIPPFPPFPSLARGTRAETHARRRRAQAYSPPPPPATRDYISRRTLRLPCGQLTGLVICYESGREGGPQRLALPVLAPDPPRWNLELLRCGPWFSSPLGHIPGVS